MDTKHIDMLPYIPTATNTGKFWKGQTRYRRIGHKILTPFTQEDFIENMEHGKFVRASHKPYAVLIYYSAVRELEGVRVTPDNFDVSRTAIRFNVGPRLKKQKHRKVCPSCNTRNNKDAVACQKCKADLSAVDPRLFGKPLTTPPLKLPLKAPYMNLLKERILETRPGERLFPFSAKTAYNIMYRAGFHYPHLCRLSRITSLFEQGWTITQIRSWTGLTLPSLEFYAGTVDTERMGDKLT